MDHNVAAPRIKSQGFALLASALLLAASAAQASPLDDLLGGEADCVKMADVRAAAKVETRLDVRQFDFVRGMWMAVPPVSRELPIGDTAELVSDGDTSGIVLVDTDADETCARLRIRDLADFLDLLAEIGEGKTVRAKDAAGRGL